MSDKTKFGVFVLVCLAALATFNVSPWGAIALVVAATAISHLVNSRS